MILLDTNVLIYCFVAPAKLTAIMIAEITDPQISVFASPVSIYEIEWKRAIGKLDFPPPENWRDLLKKTGFEELPLTLEAAAAAARLPQLHRDPWDRLLVAQARMAGPKLASTDLKLREYGVAVIS